MSTVRVPVDREVMKWAQRVAFGDDVPARFTKWIGEGQDPTLKQLTDFAASAGIPFGYLLRREPPPWRLPVQDFRDGYEAAPEEPSANLMRVIRQSQQRQEWYREYAERSAFGPVKIVGVAASWSPKQTADHMTEILDMAVSKRTGTWSDTRRNLLRNFEALGGLTVVTSMVDNNNHRMLDPMEFRGFSLVDPIAPLVFINANQTLNGQIFTIAHEFAHVWRGVSGIGDEDPRRKPNDEVERWCNEVASLLLVPEVDLMQTWPQVAGKPLSESLDVLARRYKCGTLVILQALRRYGVVEFEDFDATYNAEEARVIQLAEARASKGGDHYANLPFRVGERLSRAIVADTLGGNTTYTEAMRLMSMKSAVTFDRYAGELGGA